MIRARPPRARSRLEPGVDLGVTALGAAWMAGLRLTGRRGRAVLEQGRSLAESGAVGVLSWEPGRVSALVEADGTVRAVTVRVQRFGLPAWRRLVDVLARSPRLLAAVLDGEVPDEVVGAMGGVEALVPPSREMRATCSCAAWALACEHVAAVWCLAAHAVDRRPAAVLELRSYDADLAEAVHRRAMRALRERGAGDLDAGVDPAAAFTRAPAPLPEPLVLPEVRGTPAPIPARPAAGLAVEALRDLAADAALRAWELGVRGGDGGLALDAEADMGRRAAAVLDDRQALLALAVTAGLDAWSLSRLALAWRAGGAAAVDVLLRPWSPRPEVLGGAVAALAERRVVVDANRVTDAAGGLQLRLGRDRLWYALEHDGADWVLRAPPSADPAEAVRAARPEVPPAAGPVGSPAARSTRGAGPPETLQLSLW